jgi:hypothetical protein
MESSLTESVQQLVRPGKCVDLYYPDPETAHKQCFRTIQNTRYIQQFQSLGAGSSVFTIPPNNGIQDIILTLELPAQSDGFTYNGSAIPSAWGYALIKQVSFRYGGSSQYFLSGQQLLQNALRKTSNGSARDDLFNLGGTAAAAGAAAAGDFADRQRAYCWLSLPHCVPTADGKLPPLPTDLLTQQVQITVELFPLANIFSIATGGTPTLPTALNFAEFQVQQVILENQGDALARRVDMTSHALSYPLADFTQQEVVVPLANAVAQSITLTGFRSGECRNIQVWITKDSDTPATLAAGAIRNPWKWYAPEDMSMTYAGEVYARFDKGSAALWNLVNGRQSAAVNEVLVADAGGGATSITTPFLARWMELPFAQTYDDLTAHSTYTAGKPITNGIVNLAFNIPQELNAAADYKLHVSYNYAGVLTFSQGTCDYVI